MIKQNQKQSPSRSAEMISDTSADHFIGEGKIP